MGYFWWHWRKGGYSLVATWWAFFGQKIKREWLKTLVYQAGFAIGFMIARIFIIPERALPYFDLDTIAARK